MAAIKTILVAIGHLSAPRSLALDKAVQLATALHARVELFHDLAMTIPVETLGPKNTLRSLKASGRRTALEFLEGLAEPLRVLGLKVSTAAIWDYPPHEAIVRRALAIRADLIVVPRRKRHRAANLLGYTDWELLRLSPIPVLLVKTSKSYDRPCVLAAIDPAHAHAKPSGLDKVILQCGSQLCTALHGVLHIVHAYTILPLPPAVTFDTTLRESLIVDAERAPRQMFDKALLKLSVAPLRRHLVRGRAVDVIPAIARQTHCAIAVIGAVSRSAIKRLFIGSTAEEVMDNLTCDLLVVKPAKFASGGARTRRGPQFISIGLSV